MSKGQLSGLHCLKNMNGSFFLSFLRRFFQPNKFSKKDAEIDFSGKP